MTEVAGVGRRADAPARMTTVLLVTIGYLLLTLATLAWEIVQFLFGGGPELLTSKTGEDPRNALAVGQLHLLVEAMVVLTSQSVFLTAGLRRRLHVPTVQLILATVTLAAIAGWSVAAFWLAWGGVGMSEGEVFSVVWWVAAATAAAMPLWVLAAGVALVRTSMAIPARWGLVTAIGIGTLVVLSFTMAIVGLPSGLHS